MASPNPQPAASADVVEDRVFTVGDETIAASLLTELLNNKTRESKARLNIILEEAIKFRNHDIIDFLQANGIEIGILNNANQTAIHLLFYYGFLTKANLLFNNCDLKTNYTDINGLSHFHVACISGNTLVAEHFIREGADVNMRFYNDPGRNWNNFTPLHFAAKCARETVVAVLLAYDANPNATDSNLRTPLHLACSISMRVSNILAETINAAQDEEQTKKKILNCNMELSIIQALIKYKANIGAKDRFGHTPLFYIFKNNYFELMRAMKEAPATFICCSNTYLKVIREIKIKQKQKLLYLLNCGADATIKNMMEETILHGAIFELSFSRLPRNLPDICFDDDTSCEMIEILLKAGADVNALKGEGQSPLQMAVTSLSPDLVKLLLRYNADKTTFQRFNYKIERYFKYPNVLPCYEAVENLIEMVDILAQNGIVLNLTEYLAVLKFLIHNNADCSYSDLTHPLAHDKIVNLLDYGTRTNIMKIFNVIDNRIFTNPNSYVCIYMKLMEIAKFYMEAEIKDYINRRIISFDLEPSHLDECINEVDKMKTIPIQNDKTLYDYMMMHPHEIFVNLTTNSYREILRSTNLKDTFFLYSGIIKGHFTKGLIRRCIVKSASDYIRLLTTTDMPDLVCEKISSYLTNEELWTMCLMASMKLKNEQNQIRNNSS